MLCSHGESEIFFALCLKVTVPIRGASRLKELYSQLSSLRTSLGVPIYIHDWGQFSYGEGGEVGLVVEIV